MDPTGPTDNRRHRYIIMESSPYISDQRKDYSLYVLQHRALPSIADGLKAAARRILWVARSGHKYKSATLAGAVLPLHPHAPPESVINTLASPYNNNIPLLDGSGAFGTLTNPDAYGASRYTSVEVSSFTKEVIFADIDLVPMVDNYDVTQKEPKHFIPLIPVTLLNPVDGLAIGFSTSILPRTLKDIITEQLNYLSGKKIKEPNPELTPIDSIAHSREDNKFLFRGKFETVSSTKVHVTGLPYGISHSQFIERVVKLLDEGKINDYVDKSSSNIDVTLIFPRNGFTETIAKKLGLVISHSENISVIDFDGESVLTPTVEQIISSFTEWRLGWYENRYIRLLELLEKDIQKYLDILLAIKKNVGSIARKIQSKADLTDYLKEIGIVNLEYIVTLPVYRFTEEERLKTERLLGEARKTQKEYKSILSSKERRKEIYIDELKTILKMYYK